MAKIPTVTCARCGESFSALRADCPHCGQRRTIGGDKPRAAAPRRPARQPRQTQSGGRQPSRWQLIAGLALIGAGILAVLLMVFAARSDGKGVQLFHTPTPTLTVTVAPRPTPTPSPTPKCENVRIFYLTHEITAEAGGFTMYEGDAPLTLTARAYPNDKLANAPLIWTVSDPSKATLTPSADTLSCEVQPLESAGGYITLNVSCYGYTASVPFYIWAR